MEKKTLNKNCIEINIFYFPFQLPIAQYNDSIKIEIMLTHMSDFTEKKNVSGNSCILSFLDLYCRICCLIFLFISVIWFEQKKTPLFLYKGIERTSLHAHNRCPVPWFRRGSETLFQIMETTLYLESGKRQARKYIDLWLWQANTKLVRYLCENTSRDLKQLYWYKGK